MKRFILMLVAIGALGLVFAGCKKKDGEGDETAPKPTETEESAEKPAEEPVEEPAEEPEESAEAGDAADTGVPECDAYVAAFEKFMDCDGVPDQAKEANQQSLDAMKQGWGQLSDPNVPEASKQAAADACRQGEDALKQSASALGCEI